MYITVLFINFVHILENKLAGYDYGIHKHVI